jgi:diaminohydroxyphosphoribosylaminopyrimidine deaminase/5-amino-6-(5-phosphoribosylamino)uracil reductase
MTTLDQSPLLVVTSPEADSVRVAALRDAGAETIVAVGATPAERIASALADLGRREITSLFLEGGRILATAFAAAGQIDESRTFVAPVVLGGADPTPTEPRFPIALESHAEPVGDDTLTTARFKEW